jgi:hypothetical protein
MRLNKLLYLSLSGLVILSTLFVSSCNQQPGSGTSGTADSLKNTSVGNPALESVYYRFPTPDELFGFVNNEKLKFDIALLNPSSNADKYLNSKSQTLNTGIYIGDLAYISLFEAYNKSPEYFKNIHNLSEKIRITSAYDLEVAKRIEKNLLNLDSLKRISIDSYSSMVEYLIVNNREKTLALIAAGSYIECFYIAFNLAGKYSDSNPMVTKIADLKYAFENLYAYLLIYSDDPTVKEVADQFKVINDEFAKMEQKSMGKTTVKQTADGNIVLGGGVKLNVSKSLFEEMKNEVFKLRNNIITSY